MRLLTLFIGISLSLAISSCTPLHYTIKYNTHLLNSEPASLVYKDTLFGFEFYPVPNGLYFNITNFSNTPATLDWDRCYFIEPSGNPSRALNVDGGIREDTHLYEGARNISIIPPLSSFVRFTTSALNVREVTNSEFYYRDPGSAGYFSGKYNSFYNIGRYWPDYKGPAFAPGDSLHTKDTALSKISNYVRNNNNMGVGFCIRLKDTIVDYKFDFKIDKVEIYKVRDTTTYVLSCYTVDTSGWAWQNAPLPVPNLILPKNGATVVSLPVLLKWEKPVGSMSFAVQVSSDSLFQSTISQHSSKILASKSVIRVKNGGTYYWRVSANFAHGKSGWSAPRSFFVKLKH